MSWGIWIYRNKGDKVRRGKQYWRTRVGAPWRFRRDTYPTRAAARHRLAQLKANGWQGNVFKIEPPDPWRKNIVAAMKWALKHEPRIHYKQVRPFNPNAIKNRTLPITTDCSGSTTMLYRAAGRPDPNGAAYNGTGYTGTLRAHTPKRQHVADCKPGDFIVYGGGNGAHVVVVLKAGRDPLVWSHGQEAGPLTTRHSTQVRVHGSKFTCHNGDALR